MRDEISRWYNSILKDTDPAYYELVKKEVNDNSFLIIRKYKDGSGVSYEKCIMGSRCLFKLSFSVDYHNLKKLNEKDADVIIHLFIVDNSRRK
ncbi:MAG: hypothetical protein IAE95_10820 [Chitinophagaceae bacterium]|nr:hypothetical protein [Chitinophagaceae bacterium]